MKSLSTFLLILVLFGGFSGTLIAQEPGKIIFSKSPIAVNSPTNLVNDFKSGDHIYGMAYFSQPIKKLCKGKISKNATKYVVEILVYKNDSYITSMNPTLLGELFEGTNLVLDIAPEASKMTAYNNPGLSWKMYGKTKEGPLRFAEILSEFDEGKTTIKLEIKACYEVIASGEFTIEGENFDFYGNQMTDLQNAETHTVQMPKAKKNDPALEKEMKSLLQASSNDAWKGDIIKVVIIDNDWFLERHKLTGAILFRYIRTEVAVKKNDGCWLYRLVTFKQNYVGNKYDKTYWDGAGDRVKIPCENIK
ncbi:MAG: hypothetical protein JXR46_06045 [Calditrichaceae bacterium]|nr:hypothetical protein [Calditrichaceae bacterium]MBN2708587.1 hypothetical protein [Calditrichaceae bacterium]